MAGKRRAEDAGGRGSVRGPRAADASWGELLRARFGREPKEGKVHRTWPQRIRRWLLRLAVVGLVLALLGAAGFLYLYKTTDIPDPNEEFLTQTTFVYYNDGKTELGKFATQDRDSIPLSDMPEVLQQAVVAAEDQSFYENNGVDLKGIARAVLNNAKGGSQQGASTITQQYVKILYLTQERSYKRKVKEAILSLKIQREKSKDEVLEGYLNTIYFGRGAYGVEAAAQAYFGRSASELELRQAAVLASILNDPNDLDPANGKDARQALRGRYEYVLNSMADLGDITTEEAEKAKKRLPKFSKQDAESTYGGDKGHMLTLVKNQLLKLTDEDGEPLVTEQMIQGGGLRITTTLDEGVMADIRDGVEGVRPVFTGAKAKKYQKQLHVAAATVEPGTGRLLGFYAGQDYLDSQLNWAVAGGQAGSTFKPFAVAAGLEQGYSLKDTFDGNSPYTAIDGSEFENQGDEDYGSAISLLDATENSVNTAFIDLTVGMDDGPQTIIDTAEAMGIPPRKARKHRYGIPDETGGLEPNTGVALGSQTVSPINMANGYATIAAEGEAAEVFVIDKVVDANGDTLYKHKVVTDKAIDPDVAADVSYALQEVVTAGTGTSAIMSDGRPAAGKTGTATKTGGAVSSSWFAGFTPQLSTAVMYVRGIGNGQLDGWLPASSDGREGYFGGNYPAKTWNAIMSAQLEGEPIEEFPEPVFVDGDAPQEGHAPYVPPVVEPSSSEPTKKPDQPTDEPTTEEPTVEPTTEEPTVEPTTEEPTEEPSCGVLGCEPTSDPPTSDPPTEEPTPDPSPSASPRPSTTVRERE